MHELIQDSLEASRTAERQQREFAAIAASDLHALTYVLMTQGTGPYSRKDVRDLFVSAQGADPVWIPGSGVNFNYSADVFKPAGLATLGNEVRVLRNRKQPVDVLVTDVVKDTDVVDRNLARAGVLLDWTVDPKNPESKVLFGESRHTDQTVLPRAAQKRLILEIIVEHPGLSDVEISQLLQANPERFKKALTDLEASGIVLKERSQDWDNRNFMVLPIGFYHRGLKREDIHPATQAVYQVIENLQNEGREEITAAELYDRALAAAPTLDRSELRHIVGQSLVGETHREGEGNRKGKKFVPPLVTDGAFNDGMNTKNRVEPQLANKLKPLLDDLKAIDAGDEFVISFYKDRALEIAADEELVKSIAERQLAESAQANPTSDGEMLRMIEHALADQGALSIAGLTRVLQSQGVKMKSRNVDGRLRDLQNKGLISVGQQPGHARTSSTLKHVVAVNYSDS